MNVINEMIRHFHAKRWFNPTDLAAPSRFGFHEFCAPSNLDEFRHCVGETFYFEVRGSNWGEIYGDAFYPCNSELATACVHAGALQFGETAITEVIIHPPMPSHAGIGTLKNGIASKPWPYCDIDGSFSVRRADDLR